MKIFSPFTSTACTGIAALALLSGCGKQDQHTTDDGHGHEHGHDEAKAHITTKDGVAICAEHNVPEAVCAVCKPDQAASLQPGDSMKLRLPSPNSASIIGVQTATPETGTLSDGIDCMAEVSFSQNKLAQISAPVGGIVQSVEVDLGSKVEAQQTVAKLWSASLAETVTKAVLTRQTLERERKLWAGRVTSEQALQEAEAANRAARQQASTLGFSDEQIQALEKNTTSPIYLEVRAPFAGEIVEQAAVRGATTEAGKTLFTLVDTSVMQALLHVPETALARLQPGQAVELRINSLPGKIFTGKLNWISPAVDERTRLGRARAEFDNAEHLLRDKMFATARILTRTTEGATLVPTSAIQYVGGKPFVFVQQKADLFDARAVRLGAKSNNQQEVLSGVLAHEQIAVDHAFAIKSAMLMARLGAGCADD